MNKYVSCFDVLGEKVIVKDPDVQGIQDDIVVINEHIDLTNTNLSLEPRILPIDLKSVGMAGKNTRSLYYQGMCSSSDSIYLFTNDSKLTRFNMKTKAINTVSVSDFGHGNALAFNDKTKEIYVATLENFLTIYNTSDGTVRKIMTESTGTVVCGVGIDGDLIVKMTCPRPSGGYISNYAAIKCTVELKGKIIKTFYLEQPSDTIYAIQGTCLYKNCIYVASTLDNGVDSRQCVYVYNLNGKLLYTYYSPIADDGKYLEIEDICFYDGTFYAGFNSYYVSMIWCSNAPKYNPYVTYDNEEFCFCDGSENYPYKMRTVLFINKFILAKSRNSDQTCNLFNTECEVTLTTDNSSIRATRSNVHIIGGTKSCKLYTYDSRVNIENANILASTIVYCSIRTKLCKISGSLKVSQGSFLSIEAEMLSGGGGHLYSQSVLYAPSTVADKFIFTNSIKNVTP